MKVICIRKSRYNDTLTVGEVYDVISITNIPFNVRRYADYTGPFYKLLNDLGEISGYTDHCVRPLTIAELRDEKIKELGI